MKSKISTLAVIIAVIALGAIAAWLSLRERSFPKLNGLSVLKKHETLIYELRTGGRIIVARQKSLDAVLKVYDPELANRFRRFFVKVYNAHGNDIYDAEFSIDLAESEDYRKIILWNMPEADGFNQIPFGTYRICISASSLGNNSENLRFIPDLIIKREDIRAK